MNLILLLIFTISFAFAQVINDPLSKEKENYRKLLDTKYVLFPHKNTFLMPYVYNSLPHSSLYQRLKEVENPGRGELYKKEEAEFQISFMIPAQRNIFDSNFDLNFAYTHHAWWQVYNSQWSRPFRETNYMPELFLRYVDPTVRKIGGFDFMGGDVGYIHQSNGQVQILSRSWDRIFGRAFLQGYGLTLFATAWYRIPEARDQDDNRNIYDYMGFGELEVVKSLGKHNFSYKTPLLAKHFSSDFKYSHPWDDRLRWYASFQAGYGHSMIEYDRPTQRFGIGITLDTFLSNITGQ